MFGKVTHHNKNKITIEIDEEVNDEYLKLISENGENFAKMELLDSRKMSHKQNALSHVLIADISDYTGYEPEWQEAIMKYYYEAKTGETFSHSTASKSLANDWIDFLIEFILKNNIPLPKRYAYLLDNNSFFYYCLKYRKCCICGKHADVCHVEAVGMGRNRREIDHSEFHFYAGCREHHQEEHRIGTERFLAKYKIMPVKLDLETRKKLNIGG